MKTLQNPKAIKLIHKLIEDVSQNGIIINTVVDDLRALRPFTIQEELPLLAKATRLSAEHIEENETFAIPIPQDEPIEGEEIEVLEFDFNEAYNMIFNGQIIDAKTIMLLQHMKIERIME